jgi:hypothetical protein
MGNSMEDPLKNLQIDLPYNPAISSDIPEGL